MENASKALIIAGGVLISILIISILAYTWINVSNFNSAIDDEKKQEQISEFNMQFTSYQRQLLRGAEVASMVNKVMDNNKKYIDDSNYQMHCYIKMKENVAGLKANTEYDETKNEIKLMVSDSSYSEKLTEFKRLYFKCTGIEYNSKTGRVNKIKFEQLRSQDIFTN